MNKLLLDIYHRNLDALERPFDGVSKENRLLNRVEELHDKIKKQMPESLHPLMDDCYDAYMQAIDAVSEEDFLEGYRMGVHMMLAAWPK